MNTLALLAFAFWVLFLRYLPRILNFLRMHRFANTLPGPSIGELIATVKKGGGWCQTTMCQMYYSYSLQMKSESYTLYTILLI